MSDTARRLRLAALGMVLLALIAMGLMLGGVKGWVPRGTEPYSFLLLLGAIGGAAYLAYKSRAQTLAERDRASGQFMLVALAAQLNKQDDTTLGTIAGSGGPAGEAARLILAGRQDPRRADPRRTR